MCQETVAGLTYAARDWGVGETGHPLHHPMSWETPYLQRRRANVAENSRQGYETIEVLRGAHTGKEAMIICSGPSARVGLERFPFHEDRLTIGVNMGGVIYRGETWRKVDIALVADGIVSQGLAEREWGGRMEYDALVACVWSDPGLLREAREMDGGPYLFRVSGYGHEMAYCGVPPELPELEYCFNSGTIALHLADWMGCKTIRLIGMDMAFTAGEFHPGEVARAGAHSASMVTEDIHGNLVMCRVDQFIAARKVETWAWLLAKRGVRVINSTGGGIVKRFVEHE